MRRLPSMYLRLVLVSVGTLCLPRRVLAQSTPPLNCGGFNNVCVSGAVTSGNIAIQVGSTNATAIEGSDTEDGTGVAGNSTSGPGVQGTSTSLYGVEGTSSTSNGVLGSSGSVGVYGISSGNIGLLGVYASITRLLLRGTTESMVRQPAASPPQESTVRQRVPRLRELLGALQAATLSGRLGGQTSDMASLVRPRPPATGSTVIRPAASDSMGPATSGSPIRPAGCHVPNGS
jgi:hypothetical protein